ncbi:MAG: HAD family hydrolase [Acidimicrobiia bacterium]
MAHDPQRPSAPHVVRWDEYDAVLFDLDGVLTPTAEVHLRAWTRMFDEFLAGVTDPVQRPFTVDDYHAYVDGKPRFDGVRSFLQSRDIVLPEGDPSDPPGDSTVCALGNRKNQLFGESLASEGIDAFPGSVAVLDRLDAMQVAVAVVSSSRNAPDVLEAARLTERFVVVVDGNVAARLGLAGKPAPDMFLEAARELHVEPGRTVVVEDAVSGVAAGRAGGFALVLGVDRGAGREALLHHGADLVVGDLIETMPGGDSA